MTLQDKRGNLYNNIMDNMANFHIFSIYNVPFQSVSSKSADGSSNFMQVRRGVAADGWQMDIRTKLPKLSLRP